MTQRTTLHAQHVAAGGKMVDFAGWEMPLHFGSQVAEHKLVRSAAGLFDVSHMTVIDIAGVEAADFLGRAVANNVGKLKAPGRALYGVLLNHDAGIVDDLIVYRRASDYRLVVNAGTRAKVLEWLTELRADSAVEITERADLSILAVQGPAALERCGAALPVTAAAAELRPFRFLEAGDWLVARTGYTGEDGVELILPHTDVVAAYDALQAVNVAPIGLGARDTLRLEAGLNLYGHDMDDGVNPLAANLGWTVSWKPVERQFVGRRALEEIRATGSAEALVGVVMQERGVLREGQVLDTDRGPGVLTSGAFSPTLGYSIGFARVPSGATGKASVHIRNRQHDVLLVKPPFVRDGAQAYSLIQD